MLIRRLLVVLTSARYGQRLRREDWGLMPRGILGRIERRTIPYLQGFVKCWQATLTILEIEMKGGETEGRNRGRVEVGFGLESQVLTYAFFLPNCTTIH